MAAISLDPFRILLNNISNELEEKDLQTLKNVCAQWIPGGQRERIKDGWDFLNHLRRLNIIGDEPEKVANLLMIIKVLKRRDLSHLVKKHISKYYEQPEEIFNSVRASESLHSSLTLRNNQVALNIESTSFRSSTPCWVLNCFCCELTCYSSCLIFVTVLFAFFAVAAVLAWYANIPEVTSSIKSNDDWNRAGPFIIGFLLFIAVCSALGAICRFFLTRRYIRLNNDREDNQICDGGSTQHGADNNSAVPNSKASTPVCTRAGSRSSCLATPSGSFSSLDTAASIA